MDIGPIFRAMTRNRARLFLIVAEVALTLAIVANCVGLIVRARAAMTRPSGFDEDNLVLVGSVPFAKDFEDPAYVEQSLRDDMAALRAIPGVRSASNTSLAPWSFGGMQLSLHDAAKKDAPDLGAQFASADPATIETLGIEIIEGRNFTPQEFEANKPGQNALATQGGILISKALADDLFPDGKAVGRDVSYPMQEGRHTVLGVFAPFFKPTGGEGQIDQKMVFYPVPSAGTRGMSYLVRTEPGKASAVAAEIDRVLLKTNEGRRVRTTTVPEMRKRFHARDRMLVASLNAVMVLLVVVTALGIVGLTSFSVAERRRQIGARRALGATRPAIVRHFLLENWMVTTFGVAFGIALAYLLNYGLVTKFEGAPLDWRMLAAGAALLWSLGLASALGPALNAAKVPPAIATRNV